MKRLLTITLIVVIFCLTGCVPTANESDTTPPTTVPTAFSWRGLFEPYGFSDTEIEECKEVFETVGIYEIRELQSLIKDGTLASYKGYIYDSNSIKIHFTCENNKPFVIYLAWYNGLKTEKYYDWEKRKVCTKFEDDIMNVYLYDEDYGYVNVIDWDSLTITKYEKIE